MPCEVCKGRRYNRETLEVKYKDKNFIERYILLRKELIKNKVTYVIKEGDTFSSKHLSDVSIAQASTIIILDSDMQPNPRSLSSFSFAMKGSLDPTGSVTTQHQEILLDNEETTIDFLKSAGIKLK